MSDPLFVIVLAYVDDPGAYEFGGLMYVPDDVCATVTVNVPVKPLGTVRANVLCPLLHVHTFD